MRSAYLAATVAATAALAGCSQPQPRPGAGVAPTSVAAPASAPQGQTFSNPKLAPVLAATARKVRAAVDASAASALSTALVHVNAAGQLQAYVHVTHLGPAVKNALTNAGAIVEGASGTLGVYQVWATPAALEHMAALPDVTRITAPAYGFPRSGAPAPTT